MTPLRRSFEMRGAPRWLVYAFLTVVGLAGCGFLFKLVEFAATLDAAPEVSFALMPMVTYLAVAAGFFCLLAWATLSGQWKDLEAPKLRMLEQEAALDASVAADLAREEAAARQPEA